MVLSPSANHLTKNSAPEAGRYGGWYCLENSKRETVLRVLVRGRDDDGAICNEPRFPFLSP